MKNIPFRKNLMATMLFAVATLGAAAPAGLAVAQEAAPGSVVAQVLDYPAVNMNVGQSIPLDLSAIGAVNKVFPGNRTLVDVFQETRSGEVFLRAKKVGVSEVMIWGANKQRYRVPVSVTLDTSALQSQMAKALPGETGIKVAAVADSLVLTGIVSDATVVKQAVAMAEAYVRSLDQELVGDAKVYEAPEAEVGTKVRVRSLDSSSGLDSPENKQTSALGANRVINLLQVRGAQQVMLEVKIAEVSRTLLDRMGASLGGTEVNGSWTWKIASGLLSGTNPADNTLITALKTNGTSVGLDAQKKNGLVKILAEPNIVAISGQEGSFLSGGKLFIPTGRDMNGQVTLEEKEYGVGLRFTPTVLANGLVNLAVTPEVSELSPDGSPFTAGGIVSVLPSITTRRASTTVQLRDGESFAIAGLIKDNVTEEIKRVPILGDIPLIGMLFRHNRFNSEKTELLFVVTPRLVRPVDAAPALPTDNFREPNQYNFMINGRMEAFQWTRDDESDVPGKGSTASGADAKSGK